MDITSSLLIKFVNWEYPAVESVIQFIFKAQLLMDS